MNAVNTPSPPSRLVLASASPRRQDLLRAHGYAFEVVVSPVAEPDDMPGAKTPIQRAEALSRFKAESVRPTARDAWILSGDTIVALDDVVFGKPTDREDARRIISILAGTTQDVITGVTLLHAMTGVCRTEHDVTRVTMKPLSESEIESYLDTEAWRGKAGAYGIQDRADAFITRTEGSFSNVVGFPMELVMQMLADVGVRPSGSRPSN